MKFSCITSRNKYKENSNFAFKTISGKQCAKHPKIRSDVFKDLNILSSKHAKYDIIKKNLISGVKPKVLNMPTITRNVSNRND